MKCLPIFILSFSIVLLAACAGIGSPPTQATVPDGVYFPDRPIKAEDRGATFYFTRETDGARIHGSGPHRYRMVLLHPNRDSRVMPYQPYALSHSGVDLPFVTEEKKVFQGVTDRWGRTDIFAFETPVDAAGWNLRQRTGQGEYGEQFVFTNPRDEPIQGMAYVLLVCGPKPYVYRGISDTLGQTAYAATATAQRLSVYQAGGEPQDKQALQEACQEPANN